MPKRPGAPWAALLGLSLFGLARGARFKRRRSERALTRRLRLKSIGPDHLRVRIEAIAVLFSHNERVEPSPAQPGERDV